ncbi:RHS repeat-associated core domain-containing protein [Pseudomonas sp. GB2N2]
MLANAQEVICTYYYDPLNRLVGTSTDREAELRRFYCKERLATEIQGSASYALFQQDVLPLAQLYIKKNSATISLLATDQPHTILHTLRTKPFKSFAYSPYGYSPVENCLLSLLGFNGQRRSSVTGHYMLGNGCRAFNPVIMRFNSPDSFSPFGRGGLNAYMYCLGDPVNQHDMNGHFSLFHGAGAALTSMSNKIAELFKSSNASAHLKGGGNPRIRTASIGSVSEAPKVIKNIVSSIAEDYRAYEMVQNELNGNIIRNISTSNELRSLERGELYKYVLTDQYQLVVGGYPGKHPADLVSHSVLSQFAGSNKVISAGYIKSVGGKSLFEVNNYSGHYKPSVESLMHIKKFVEDIDGRVRLIRYSF